MMSFDEYAVAMGHACHDCKAQGRPLFWFEGSLRCNSCDNRARSNSEVVLKAEDAPGECRDGDEMEDPR